LIYFFLYSDSNLSIDLFVFWYSERNMRMIQIQDNIVEQKNLKDKLESEQEKLHMDYDKVCLLLTLQALASICFVH